MTGFAAALSEHPLATHAVGECVGHLLEAGGPRPDLVTVAVTEAHLGAFDDVVAAVRHLLEPHVLVGVTAQSVLGGAREVEDHAALVVSALWSGGARVRPVRLDLVTGPDGPRVRGRAALDGATGTLLLLGDPFTFPSEVLLAELAERAPGLAVVGGMASAARRPGGNRVALDAATHDHGAVAALIDASVPIDTVVSQGCRPIGEPLIVTASERHMVRELGGRPALDRLMEAVDALDEDDRRLTAGGVHLGRVVDEHLAEFGPGDFLVRAVSGADRSIGAVAVADEVPVGATVQFQVRDAASAHDDLLGQLAGRSAAGALCFTDVARGSSFFGTHDHDAEVTSESLGTSALAGVFCAGTLAPVSGTNAVHDAAMCVLLVDPDR